MNVNQAPAVLKKLKEFVETHIYVNDSTRKHEKLFVHGPVEIRSVKSDDIWLSPAYDQDIVFIGIIMYKPYGKEIPIKEFWGGYERIMMEHGGRPHWAKVL